MSQVPDTFGCVDNTIKVSAGHYVDLANPAPETIDIYSIAAALSKTCRFGGHTPMFYSVAEHCVHATRLAVAEGYSKAEVRAVLMHDAPEAYVGDVVKPLKIMMPEYAVIEKRIEDAIAERFGIDFEQHENMIKRFDRAMLKIEKVTMWPEDKEKWEGFSDIEDRELRLEFWSPGEAQACFLGMAKSFVR